LLSLAAFVVAKHDGLSSSAHLGDLHDAVRGTRPLVQPTQGHDVAQILVSLDFAATWGEAAFFADPDAGTYLYYELLRAADPLRKLARFASPAAAPSARNVVALVDFFGASLASPAPSPATNSAASPDGEEVEAPAASMVYEADAVLKVIRDHADKLELVESAALEDVRCVARPFPMRLPRDLQRPYRPFSDAGHRVYFGELLRYCAQDALSLVPD
jgi:hypothetical protein